MAKNKTGMKWYSLGQMLKNWREAERDAKGYRDDPSDVTERRAILDKTKSILNRVYIRHECLSGDTVDRNRAKQIRKYYRERFKKTMGEKTSFGSRILPLPRDYIPSDFGLTDKEYKLLCLELNGEQVADTETLEGAKKKMLSRSYTDEELMRIYDFFDKANKALCKVIGIKEEDVMYSVAHFDESNPYLHFCFLPSRYIEDKITWEEYNCCPKKKDFPKELKKKLKGDTNRVIREDEQPVGCGQQRFTAPYLHFFLPNLEKSLRELGVEAHLANGKGHYMNVQQLPKEVRKATVITRNLEEVSKLHIEDNEKQIADQEAQMSKNEATIKAQEAELAHNKATIKELQQEIKGANEELKGLKRAIKKAKEFLGGIGKRIDELVNNGINKIWKAKTKKEKDEAAKESEGQLLRIKTDADMVLNAFLPFDDDEEEKVDPEEEYDGERGDI